MDLAGLWAIDGGVEPIILRPWRFEVPTEMWDLFLSTAGYRDFDIIELRRVMHEGGHLSPAIAYLSAARALVSSAPTEAVAQCRFVIEAVDRTLRAQGSPKIAAYLAECTDKRRGQGYRNILLGITHLTHVPHHELTLITGTPKTLITKNWLESPGTR